jgi:hypothetical protein
MDTVRTNMIYMIDNTRQPEQYFWNCLHILATDKQICRVLEGLPLIIGATRYQIIFGEE